MKSLSKRLLSLAVVLIMLLTFVPAVFAAETDEAVPSFSAFLLGDLADGNQSNVKSISIFLNADNEDVSIEDFIDFVLTLDGEAVEFEFASDEWTAETVDADGANIVVYSKSFAAALTEPGVYELTFKFKGEDSSASLTVGDAAEGEDEPEAPSWTGPDSLSVIPTSSTVLVDGESVTFDAYTVVQNNFFKLRDLAYILTSVEGDVTFSVSYVAEENAIYLVKGEAYEEVGGEMQGKGEGAKTAEINKVTKVYVDGELIDCVVYAIEGNNYFMLRSIGEALDFDVTWESATNTIVIDTSSSYTAD